MFPPNHEDQSNFFNESEKLATNRQNAYLMNTSLDVNTSQKYAFNL